MELPVSVKNPAASKPARIRRRTLWQDVKYKLRVLGSNRPALVLVVANAFLNAAFMIPLDLIPIYVKHIMKSNWLVKWWGVVCAVAVLISIPFWIWLSKKPWAGKRLMIFVSGLWIAVTLAITGAVIGEESPAWFFCLLLGLGQLGTSGQNMFSCAMKPDVIDYGEFLCGERNEALLMSFFLFISKIVTALTILVLKTWENQIDPGADLKGSSEGRKKVEFDYNAQVTVRVIYGAGYALFWFGCTLVLLFFRINRRNQPEIVAATLRRLNGQWAKDPLKKGDPLPPYQETLPPPPALPPP